MSGSVEAILAEAVQLPADQRLTLAHRILSSVEPEPSAATDAAWDREIRDRIARYDAGEAQSIPATEVFAELDRRLWLTTRVRRDRLCGLFSRYSWR